MNGIAIGRQRVRKLLPICCFCGRTRDERGRWIMLIQETLDGPEVLRSHTFCRECGRKHYGSLAN
jgi:predicted Fe-S protein YdhL (DUF1289 family)